MISNGSDLTWKVRVSWEGCFHQGAGEGGVSPVETLVWGMEEGRERRIIGFHHDTYPCLRVAVLRTLFHLK